MKPGALAVIWYWPAAVGRSAVMLSVPEGVMLALVGITVVIDDAEGVEVVLRVTMLDGAVVPAATALKVTVMSALATPQKPVCGHDSVAVMKVSGPDCVVREES